MNEREGHPDSEAPSSRSNVDEGRRHRGRLRIYLGYAPGVGKTFRMLEDARELLASGTEVVIGVVDTHRRYDTQSLVLGLPLLPRRRVEQGGRIIEELDLDAALERSPAVLIVDDLASANTKGARHEKRWQDVLDLLDRGIHVHTTLNVHHIESLRDVVAKITTMHVKDTVPDEMIDRADEIEIVDISPEELLVRLKEGQVSVPEEAARALEHFFRRGNLLALRELSLRCAADRVAADVRAYRAEEPAGASAPVAPRFLLWIGPSPESAELVRAARRMAGSSRAEWIVTYIENAAPSLESRARLDAHLRLAESLGAEIARLSGTKIAETLIDYARRRDVTCILVGKPPKQGLFARLRGSVIDELIHKSSDIGVHVLPCASDGKEVRRPEATSSGSRGLAWALFGTTLATGLAFAAKLYAPSLDVAFLYILAIAAVATRIGRGSSIATAALSVAAYNLFFEPAFLPNGDVKHRVLLVSCAMLASSVVAGSLTARIQTLEARGREREQRALALQTLSRELGASTDAMGLAEILARHVSELLRCEACVLLPDDAGELDIASATNGMREGVETEEVALWVMEHGRPAGPGTNTLPEAPFVCFPLGAAPAVLGVLAIAKRGGSALRTDERHTVLTFARLGAIALSRARLAEEAKRSTHPVARIDDLRTSLLGTVSHDLRAPIATIAGAAAALRDPERELSDEQRADLLDSIRHEADQLEGIVGNLLELTRIEGGKIELKRRWCPVPEILERALARMETKLAGRKLTLDVPNDLPQISVDPLLMTQVIVNLLDNVERHTPKGSPFELRAREGDGDVTIEVLDSGPGIAPGSESRVFEKFFRGPGQDGLGAGLGLAICKGVVEAHDGTIVCDDRDEGGAVFRIRLPFSGPPPVMPSESPPPDDDASPHSQ